MSTIERTKAKPLPTGQHQYEAFRVTGWIEPGRYCFDDDKTVVIDVTEPLDKSESVWMALSQRTTVMPGEVYTRLLVNNRLWMSDTHDEYRDHMWFIHQAHGRVLIHGLGLGCSLKAILQKPNVEHVDVVEISQQVLDVIGPYFESDPRVNLICDDALTREWPKGMTWDVVWHDIWDVKSVDDLGTTRAKLNRRFARRAGWQGGWAQEFLKAEQRRDRESGWW